MKRTGYLGLSLLLIFALALPGLAQNADDAYRVLYNEKDPKKKAELSEKFLTDFKDSQYREPIYQLMVQAYVQTQNWAKLIESGDKLATAIPNSTAKAKIFVYQSAMVGAQQTNNSDKIVDFADKTLAADPSNINAQIVLATTLPEKQPADTAANDKAFDLANKALTGLKQVFSQPKPANLTDAQWAQEKTNLEAPLHSAIAFIHLNRKDYDKAIETYGNLLKMTPKDGIAYFRMGLAYQYKAAAAGQAMLKAIEEENTAKRAQPIDQPLVDELVAKRQGIETEARDLRDKAIDSLATAVAIGGVVAQPARDALEKLYRVKMDGSLDGLDQLINEKKGQVGQ